MHSFNRVAWFYDVLARAVFGSALINAQKYLVRAVPAGARVLIVGGGTGRILDEITKIHPSGLSITYVDASAKMVARARSRFTGANELVLIAARLEDANLREQYDVVVTPFLFDNFNGTTAKKVFTQADNLMKPHGCWLTCDFKDTGRPGHRFLLYAMYLFFRAMGCIGARRQPDTGRLFHCHGYGLSSEQAFRNGFVLARVYHKQASRICGHI